MIKLDDVMAVHPEAIRYRSTVWLLTARSLLRALDRPRTAGQDQRLRAVVDALYTRDIYDD